MFTKLKNLHSVLGVILTTFAAAFISLACHPEPDLHLDFADKSPPTFSISGRSTANTFELLEVSRTQPLTNTKPPRIGGQTIWQISPPQGIQGNQWPVVTYGQVPTGFSQSVPVGRAPEALIEGKTYVARIAAADYDSGIFLEIRNGHIVNVSDEMFR